MNKGPYDDIIGMPHHVSTKHPQMSPAKRAAQFMPFKALSGHDEDIEEAARVTSERVNLDADAIASLDDKLQMLTDMAADHPKIEVTFFQADEQKDGGSYPTITGRFKKVDEYERVIVLLDRKRIPIDDLVDIQSELYDSLE